MYADEKCLLKPVRKSGETVTICLKKEDLVGTVSTTAELDVHETVKDNNIGCSFHFFKSNLSSGLKNGLCLNNFN